MLILRAKIALSAVICMILFIFSLIMGGLITSPKPRILSFVFSVLCFEISFNTKHYYTLFNECSVTEPTRIEKWI